MDIDLDDNEYFPYTCALEITLACNMECIHCGSDAYTDNRVNPLRLEEWFDVIDKLKDLKCQLVTLSGGEPFVYPHWKNLVSYIFDKNMTPLIISNGSLVSEDDIIFMKSKKLGSLAISLDGVKELHDEIRNFSGAYQSALNTIKMAHKHGLTLGVVTSFNKINFDSREEILKDLVKHNVKNWQVQVVNSFGRAGKFRDSMIISEKDYIQLINDITKWRKDYKNIIRINTADSIGYCHEVTENFYDGNFEWQGCSAGLYNIGIEANGDVKGCLSLQEKYFVAGNVREKDLKEIWHDKNSFAYTRNYDIAKMKGHCGNCDSKELCKSGCIAMAYSNHGTIYENSYCYKANI